MRSKSAPTPVPATRNLAARYDAVVLGGGLAGLTLALQLRQARPGTRILVLERRPFPVPEAAHKVGESTVEIAAEYFTHVLGLKEHILENQLPKNGLRFFWKSEPNASMEDGLELGWATVLPAPTYQLDRGVFENYLARAGSSARHHLGRRGARHRGQTRRGDRGPRGHVRTGRKD